MIRPLKTIGRAAAGVLLVAGLAACDTLFFDLASVPLEASDTSSPPDDTERPPTDTAVDTRDPDTGGRDSSAPDTRDGGSDGALDVDTGRPDPAESCFAAASCAYLDCPNLAEPCVDQAIDHAAPSERQAATVAMNCTRANGCDYYFGRACLDANCEPSTEECLGAEPTGGLFTCVEIVNCRRQCPENEADCPSDCVDNGSFGGRRRFGDLQDCLRTECDGISQPRDECLRDNCAAAFEACMQCP